MRANSSEALKVDRSVTSVDGKMPRNGSVMLAAAR